MKAPEKIYIDQRGLPDERGRDITFAASDFRWNDADTTYIREDLAMCWVPVEEANLQDGEYILACDKNKHWFGCRFVNDKFWDAGEQVFFITHIMRIKPPASVDRDR